ncbi:MAG TPA: recombination mediator RecR [Candidatus Paceibacterota bacterium]|nr:recombination mediator RecR [Candidatus Paceibacterota bacterium]HPT40333.1 recombination mediator RecR [Candidatus Paceibacterota bacterium]
MNSFPNPIKKFVEIFSKLPSIGQRQATRLAFYLARKNDLSKNINSAIETIANDLKICDQCFLPFEKNGNNLCPICSDQKRNQTLICLAEKEIDAFSIEKTKTFIGTYHILGRLIDPSDQRSYDALNMNTLEERIKNMPEKKAEEIIIAVNPTTEGDLTAMYLERRLKDLSKKITRLGRGIPTGGELEFADEETISGAFDNRK